MRFSDGHDAQEILEWAGGKRLYSLTAIPSECIIEVVEVPAPKCLAQGSLFHVMSSTRDAKVLEHGLVWIWSGADGG